MVDFFVSNGAGECPGENYPPRIRISDHKQLHREGSIIRKEK